MSLSSLLVPVLLQNPFGEFVDRVGFSQSHRGALFLLAGGLFFATLITITLLAVQAVSPGNGNPYAILYRPRAETLIDPTRRRRITPRMSAVTSQAREDPAAAFLRGRMAGRAADPQSLDDILDKAIQSGLGEPRILGSSLTRKSVRFYACTSCDMRTAAGTAGRSYRDGSCAYERGYLTGGFERLLGTPVTVKETRCRDTGAAHCEFEIEYGAPQAEPGAPVKETA